MTEHNDAEPTPGALAWDAYWTVVQGAGSPMAPPMPVLALSKQIPLVQEAWEAAAQAVLRGAVRENAPHPPAQERDGEQ